ncbi:Anthocyanidin 3-O-glucosyltransferase 5, partial [Cucurbita argyrosperma subsp. sororia]
MESQPHVALVSSPGMGHLFPSLELATRLSMRHHLSVTVFIVPSRSSSAENKVIAAAQAAGLFTVIELPPADMSDVTESAVVGRLCITMRRHVPALRSAVSTLTTLPPSSSPTSSPPSPSLSPTSSTWPNTSSSPLTHGS